MRLLARASPALLALALLGCPKRVPPATGPLKPETYKVLGAAEEAETSTRAEERPDVFVRTERFDDHTPRVVAKGAAGPLSLRGGRAQLYGDEAAGQGFSVDNFVLFEVVNASGKVTHRFVAGMHEGVTVDNQEPDNVGPSSFNLEAGLDVTGQLPADEPFTLRATALDYGGVGRVSDVYLVVSARTDRTPSDDELKSR